MNRRGRWKDGCWAGGRFASSEGVGLLPGMHYGDKKLTPSTAEWRSTRCPLFLECCFAAQMRDLPLHAGTDVGEGKAELVRTAPANRCAVDGKRVDFILWVDTTLQFSSHGNCNGTPDATATTGKVSQLSLPGHLPTLRKELTPQMDCHPRIPTLFHPASPDQHGLAS